MSDADEVARFRAAVWDAANMSEQMTAEEIRAALRAALSGEYGRLLAERDRLISEGADPGDLLIPDPPPAAS